MITSFPASSTRIIFLVLILGMCGCATSYYQVIETASIDAPIKEGFHVFENDDIQVVYDFWSRGGSMRFQIWNKTELPLYIDWEKSHLVHNGHSLDYWDDDVRSASFYASATQLYLRSSGSIMVDPYYIRTSTSTTGSSSKRSTVETVISKPKRVINLPPHSAVSIDRFQLMSDWYYDCDFNLKTTAKGNPQKRAFSATDSPLTFRNFLVYATDDTFTEERYIDNAFHVASAEIVPFRSYWGLDREETKCDVYGVKVSSTSKTRNYQKGSAFFQPR